MAVPATASPRGGRNPPNRVIASPIPAFGRRLVWDSRGRSVAHETAFLVMPTKVGIHDFGSPSPITRMLLIDSQPSRCHR
jgi:hypothetical protein